MEPDRPPITIRYVYIACWIPKATNTHSRYVMRIDFARQQWLHERAYMFLYITFPVLFEMQRILLQLIATSFLPASPFTPP
jgi:hypothetical protein